MKYQREAEERYQKWEEQHWQKETELEEKQLQKEQQHEIRLSRFWGALLSQEKATILIITYHPITLTINTKLDISDPPNPTPPGTHTHTHTYCYPITK